MNRNPFVETQENTITEYQKSQQVRLYDVFLVAPFLFYVGNKATGLARWERYGIYLIAAGTLIYNGSNYLRNRNR